MVTVVTCCGLNVQLSDLTSLLAQTVALRLGARATSKVLQPA